MAARLSHLLALALLALGLAWPWVALDPRPQRAASFADLATLAAGENLPPFVRQMLAERGFAPGLSADRLWSVIGRDDHADTFAFVAARERLFAWDFLRLPTSLSVKTAVIAGFLALLVGLGALFARLAAAPRAWLAGAAAATALLLIVTAPLLDSFGFTDKWGLAWLDVLTGARVTLAPRALAPLGLLLLAGALLWPGAAAEDESDPWP